MSSGGGGIIIIGGGGKLSSISRTDLQHMIDSVTDPVVKAILQAIADAYDSQQ